MRERTRRWMLRTFVALGLSIALYYLTFGGVYTVFDMRDMRRDHRRLTEHLDSLRTRTDSLAARADSLETDRLAIERTAREEHGMIREGEVLVRFHPVERGREEQE